jgi:hypothetical protein
MATDSIAGLFTDPYTTLQQQSSATDQRAAQFAQMTPLQQAQFGIYGGASRLGGGLAGLMGVEDPQMKLQSARQQVLRGLDPTNVESISRAAQTLAQAGDQQGAMQLAQRALEIRNTESQISGRTEEKQAQRDMQIQIARDRNDAMLQAARERIQSNLDIAERRGADAKELAQMRIEGQKELKQLAAGMGNGLTDLKKQLLEEKLATEKEKKVAAAEATTSRLENLIDSTANVMTTIEKAKGQVSGTTAGMGGRLLGWTTSATDLEETLNTVKANLGFDRLQQMRNESKTGGALGQVAVKELDRLEAARASLNRAQSPEQLKSNLDNVYQAYSTWRTAATKALAEKQKTGASTNTPSASNLTFEEKVQRTMAANPGASRVAVETQLRAAGHK